MSRSGSEPDPPGNWADGLVAEAGRRWCREHRLLSFWLGLQQRLLGKRPRSGLERSDSRGHGLLEPELDPEESARIRRAWLEHITEAGRRTAAEQIRCTVEQWQQRQERWSRGEISPAELEQLRWEKRSDERMQGQLALLMRVASWLLR